MLIRGFDGDPARAQTENSQLSLPVTATAAANSATSTVVPAAGRFVRDAAEFATGKPPYAGTRTAEQRWRQS